MDVSVWSHEKKKALEFENVGLHAHALSNADKNVLNEILDGEIMCVMCSVGEHRITIGSTVFETSYVKGRIKDRKTLLVRHPIIADVFARVTINLNKKLTLSERPTPAKFIEDVYEIRHCTMQCTLNFKHAMEKMAISTGFPGSFFPPHAGGSSFSNLRTVMPATVHLPQLDTLDDDAIFSTSDKVLDQARIDMPIPLLDTLMEKYDDIYPLTWLAYDVYGACVLEHIDPRKLKAASPEDAKMNFGSVCWPEFLENVLTMSCCDPRWNKYYSDLNIVAVRRQLGVDNKMHYFFEVVDTESMQRPLSDKKLQPDDCEDWAMFAKMKFLAFKYYAKMMSGKTDDEVRAQMRESKLLKGLDNDTLDGIWKAIQCIAKLIEQGKLYLKMCCGVAGAPSLSKKYDASDHPSGHEFCVLYATEPCEDKDKCFASVVEGTAWVKTTEASAEDAAELNEMCVNFARDRGFDENEVRLRGFQHVGNRHSSVFESFWRNIVGFGTCGLVSADPGNDADTQDEASRKADPSVQRKEEEDKGYFKNAKHIGANLGELLDWLETGRKNGTILHVDFAKNLDPKQIQKYKDIFEIINLPKAEPETINQKILENWKPACNYDDWPEHFKSKATTQENFIFYKEQRGVSGLAFMSGYLYCVQEKDNLTQ